MKEGIEKETRKGKEIKSIQLKDNELRKQMKIHNMKNMKEK